MPSLSRSASRRSSVYGALAVVTIVSIGATVTVAWHATPTQQASVQSDAAAPTPTNVTLQEAHASAAAEQLRKRLAANGSPVPSAKTLQHALDQRKALLSRATTAMLVDDGKTVAEKPVALFAEADWLVLHTTAFNATYDFDTQRMANDLHERFASVLGSGSIVVADAPIAHDNDARLLRATLPQRPSEGYEVDWIAAATIVRDALVEGEAQALISAKHHPASVVVTDASGATVTLELLSTGRSNFAHSPWGRAVNIRKGLDERVNGTIVPQGMSFSFNSAIGPMTSSRGWKEALGIFEGVNLKPIVGGGICQVATTVYRAALLAGLPVDARKNHSLYVSYYKEYGVGLDATVFPGQQDLTYRNDTPGPLFIESWTEEDDAYVRIYGIPDGRAVALEGPFYAATAPEGFQVTGSTGDLRAMRKNEIAWQRIVTMSDGAVARETIVSRYNAVPKSLVAAAMAEREEQTMHTAAPEQASL